MSTLSISGVLTGSGRPRKVTRPDTGPFGGWLADRLSFRITMSFDGYLTQNARSSIIYVLYFVVLIDFPQGEQYTVDDPLSTLVYIQRRIQLGENFAWFYIHIHTKDRGIFRSHE